MRAAPSNANRARAALLRLLELRAGNWVATDLLARLAGPHFHARIDELRGRGYAIQNLKQRRGRTYVSFYRIAPEQRAS